MGVSRAPKWGPILGPKGGASVHTGQIIRDIPMFTGCIDMGQDTTPKMVPFWGLTDAHQILGPRIPDFWVFRGVQGVEDGSERRNAWSSRVCACV